MDLEDDPYDCDGDDTNNPANDKLTSQKKTVRNYFPVIRSEASNSSSELSSSSNKTISLFKNCAYLDGNFFKVFEYNEEQNNISTQCKLCLLKTHCIKSKLGVSTNFLKHLKSVHDKFLQRIH